MCFNDINKQRNYGGVHFVLTLHDHTLVFAVRLAKTK